MDVTRYKYIGTKNGKHRYKSVHGETVRELEKNIQEMEPGLGKWLDLFAKRDTFKYRNNKCLKLKKAEISAKRYDAYKAQYAKTRL